MAKEIPEESKNYNKYPGEQVVALPDERVKIAEKNFRLVKSYKDGFNSLALEQRYGHVFDKFDYIVGDWGHELLRLRGFYENNHKHVEADEKINHLADYLQEYCAYGCAYFVLQRERADGEVDEAFVADKEDLQMPKKQRERSHDKGRNDRDRDRDRQSNRGRRDDGFSTVRPDGGTKTRQSREKKPVNNSKPIRQPKKKSTQKFTIRERKD